MKQFVLAAEEVINDRNGVAYPYSFDLGTRKVTFRKPLPGELFVAVAAVNSRGADMWTNISSGLDIFYTVLDPQDKPYIHNLLTTGQIKLAPEDGDDENTATVIALLEYLIEAWSGDPTGPSSDSSPGEPQPGGSSMPSTPPSILPGSHLANS